MRALAIVCCLAGIARADDDHAFDHPDDRWWVSAQVNVVAQGQPGFHAPYSGPNSFLPGDHFAVSYVATVFTGLALTSTTAVMFSPESAGGTGLSNALGIAGFVNLDVVRNPSLGPAPYVGRLLLLQIVPLSDTKVAVERPFGVLRQVAERRLELRAGKMSTVDIFDTSDVGSDSHRQFLNWAVDNNAAYDYAADTRGYTIGAALEYLTPRWALRFGSFLMPEVANGLAYDFDVAHARGDNAEIELRGTVGERPGFVKLLGYVNHANMGNYDESIALGAATGTTPDITATRRVGRSKLGGGLSAQLELADDVRAFTRLGIAQGANESFAYTECESTIEVAADVGGRRWGRDGDRLGLAAVTNGIWRPHRTYLALGGLGFILGDGALRYGRESIVEAYYTARIHRGVWGAADVQLVRAPGYNVDRGPVFVAALRLHLEL